VRVVDSSLGAVVVPIERTPGAPAERDVVCLYVPHPDGTAGTACHTADAIQSGFGIGSSGVAVYGLVPDGVAIVRLHDDAGSSDLRVENNFFYAPSGATTAPRSADWLDHDGSVIRTIDYQARSAHRPETSLPADPAAPCDEHDPHCVYVDARGNLKVGPEATREEIEEAKRRGTQQPSGGAPPVAPPH
jgi:hypothetical protein